MIRTFITPTQNNHNLMLDFPDDYLGEELEVIVFKKQEGLVNSHKNTLTMADFWGKLPDEAAKKIKENISKMKAEWENDI